MSSEIDYVFTNMDQRVLKFPKTLHYFCSKRRWGLCHFSNTTVSAMFFRFVWGNRCGAPCSLHWKTQLKPYSLAFAGNEKTKKVISLKVPLGQYQGYESFIIVWHPATRFKHLAGCFS